LTLAVVLRRLSVRGLVTALPARKGAIEGGSDDAAASAGA
jgi:hypothetical protein